MKYPAIFAPAEEGGFVVTFRDVPEAITQGDDEAEAVEMASDALVTAMEFYFEDKRQVPRPSAPRDGERLIALPISVVGKVLLLNRMIAGGVRASDLARLMGVKPQEVNRLIDLRHTTKIDTIAQAMEAMGYELDIIETPKNPVEPDSDPLQDLEATRGNDNSYALAA
jgi:antitoxin HicB